MKKREDFKALLQYNHQTSSPNCHGQTIEDVPHVALEFYSRQAKLNQLFLEFTAEQGVRWLFGYANYINQNYAGRENVHNSHSFAVGTLLMVDFFGGYGNELTFDHPAIVLQDLRVGLIIAPLTSNPRTYQNASAGKNPLHIPLPKNIPNLGNLYKNSTIRLDQLRYISKTRILSRMERENKRGQKVKQRVNFISTLQQLETALSKFLSPHVFQDLESQQLALEQEKLAFEQEKIQYQKERLAFEQEKAEFQTKIASNSSEHA